MKIKKEKKIKCTHHCEICHTLNICCNKACPQCLYQSQTSPSYKPYSFALAKRQNLMCE